MASNPFNSVGGYSVGIPPVEVIDTSGNIHAVYGQFEYFAVTVDAEISGNMAVSGLLQAENFHGNFSGNINASLTIPDTDTQIIYSHGNTLSGAGNLTWNNNSATLALNGNLIANTYTLGYGTNQFVTSSIQFATSASTSPNQSILNISASNIAALEIAITSTDTVAHCLQFNKIIACTLAGNIDYVESGTVNLGSSGVATFAMAVNAGNIQLLVTPLSADSTTYKMLVTSYTI